MNLYGIALIITFLGIYYAQLYNSLIPNHKSMAYRNQVIRNPVTGQEIRFLETANDTNGEFLEMETVLHPYSIPPTQHYHPFQVEDFTIISGQLTVRMDNKLSVYKQGDTLHIPRNTIHSMWNDSDQITVVHWKVQPALNMEQFLEIATGMATEGKTNDRGVPNILQAVVLLNRYSRVYRPAGIPFILLRVLLLLLRPIAYLFGYRSDFRRYIN